MSILNIADDAMRMLLAGEDRILRMLRDQYAEHAIKSHECTGVGFFVHYEIPSHARRPGQWARLAIGDVSGRSKQLQNGFGFVLFLTEGVINTLECHTYGEAWPDTGLREYELFYEPGGDVRDLDLLRKKWSEAHRGYYGR